MTRTTRRVILAVTSTLSAAVLILFLRDPSVVRDDRAPHDLAGLGRWMTEHPADWRAASAIAEASLDLESPDRALLWRTAHAHARRLAPQRTTATAAFVRGGLYHWAELTPADREDVLRAAAPLLREPRTFMAMHRPLWELTHDFRYLRRHAPPTEAALNSLRDIAAANGLFADYRELRTAVATNRLQRFRANRASLNPPDMVMLLPPRLTTADAPLVREVLEELQRRPLDAGNVAAARGRAAELVRFAVAHGLRPLDGIDAYLGAPEVDAPTRALLAAALGRAAEASDIELTAPNGRGAQWVPYFLKRSELESAAGHGDLAILYRRRAAIAGEGSAWTGLCGRDEVCNHVTKEIDAHAQAIEIAVETTRSDDVPPYVEIYVDDALAAEGAVTTRQVFRVEARPEGRSRVEVRLANPLTRNRVQRRVRLS